MLNAREVILVGMIDGIAAAMDDARDEGVEPVAQAIYSARAYVQHVRNVEGVPDKMPLGWNRPAPASNEELCDVLDDALKRVSIGDSFEGTITWTMPTDEPELEGSEFGLVARYRIGNLDGQGGMRVFTKEAPP